MSGISRMDVEALLQQIVDPYMGQDLVTAKAVKNITVQDAAANVEIVLGYPAKGYQDELAEQVREKLQSLFKILKKWNSSHEH